jgi:hypothetical protein
LQPRTMIDVDRPGLAVESIRPQSHSLNVKMYGVGRISTMLFFPDNESCRPESGNDRASSREFVDESLGQRAAAACDCGELTNSSASRRV